MQMSVSQYAVRVTCGLGLLLVPAVQQKVCTWPAPREPDRPVAPAPPSTATEQSQKKTKRPLTLAALLPDVVPPRWPNHAHLTAIQRVRPFPTEVWMTGSAGSDDAPAGPIGFDTLLPGGWSRQAAQQRCPVSSSADLQRACSSRHVFQTSILTTGPPQA